MAVDPSESMQDPPAKRSRGRPKLSPGHENASVGPESLIDLTCRLLDDLPPSQITRVSIARAAHVDPRLIRYYFKDRDTLIGAAAQKLTNHLLAMNAGAEDHADRKPLARLKKRIANLFRFKLRHPYYHRLMLEEAAKSKDPETRAYFLKQNEAVLDFYRKEIHHNASPEHASTIDPAFLYLAIIGMCEAFVTGGELLPALGIDRDDDIVQERYAEFIQSMVTRMLEKA